MYIDVVPNRNSPPAVLLREAWREGQKTRKRTVANLSDWPPERIETFRRLLRAEPLVSPHDLFTTQKSLPHGHVEAILEFFSSRRRHTRSLRDWSSDVCSSDLLLPQPFKRAHRLLMISRTLRQHPHAAIAQ